MRTMFSPIPLSPSLAGALASATVCLSDRAGFARWALMDSVVMDSVSYSLDLSMIAVDSATAMTSATLMEIPPCFGGHTVGFAGQYGDVALVDADALAGRIEARLDGSARVKSSGVPSGFNVGTLAQVAIEDLGQDRGQDRRTDELGDRRYESFNELNQT